MEKVLLKKIILVPQVLCTEGGEDYIDKSQPEVVKDIYGLFNIYPISMDMEPVGGRFFDSLEELNETLGTDFKEEDVEFFGNMRTKKDEDRKEFLKNAGKKKK